jgi:prepilin-type N-terminal cleavage/methylation domain-containing protein
MANGKWQMGESKTTERCRTPKSGANEFTKGKVMNESSSNRMKQLHGFTIVELLVVIAIIAILAGLLLPAIARAKIQAQRKIAGMEMASLEGAIKTYDTDYGRMPATNAAINDAQCKITGSFTYGTVHAGTALANPDISKNDYKVSNAELIAMLLTENLASAGGPGGADLRPISRKLNPKQTQLFTAKFVTDTKTPGIGPDGVLRDPWGNPYMVTLDLYGKDVCTDPVYGVVRGSVCIWSFGPDKAASPNKDDEANKDNVLSWGGK